MAIGYGQALDQDQYVRLYPYLVDGKYGYVDSDGKVVIEPQYQEATLFGSKVKMKNLLKQNTISRSLGNLPPHMAEVNLEESERHTFSNSWQIIDTAGICILKTDSLSKHSSLFSSSRHPRVSTNVKGFRIQYKNHNTRYYHIESKELGEEYGLFLVFYKGDYGDWDDEKVVLWQPVGEEDQCLVAATTGPEKRMDLLSGEGFLLKENIKGISLGPPYAELNSLCRDLTKNIISHPVDTVGHVGSIVIKTKKNLSTAFDNHTGYYLEYNNERISKAAYERIRTVRILGEEMAYCFNYKEEIVDLLDASGTIVKTYRLPEVYIKYQTITIDSMLLLRSKEEIVFPEVIGVKTNIEGNYGQVDEIQEELFSKLHRQDEDEIYFHDSQWYLDREDELISLKVGSDYLVAKVKRPGSLNYFYRIMRNDNTKKPDYNLSDSYSDVINLKYGWADTTYKKRIMSIPKARTTKSRTTKSNSVFRNGSKYRLFIKEEEANTKRFIVAQENKILMDTIADGFIAFDRNNSEVELLIGSDTVTYVTKQPGRQLYRSYVYGTDIYRVTRSDSIVFCNKKDETINSIFKPNNYAKLDNFQLTKLNENRFLMEKEDGYIIVNREGMVLDEIKASNDNYRRTSFEWNMVNIYGRAMLVFKDVKPFLYDFEELKEYRRKG